jgi:hypothetical protein|tara:strand:+ start:1624 stop:1959 length:336 start_codon:yes stop_codon:yes gene_type:complete
VKKNEAMNNIKKIKISIIGLFFATILIGQANQKEYDIKHLIKKNGLYIKKFSDEKVNGEVFRMFGDMKAPLGKMKNRKQEGKWVDLPESEQNNLELYWQFNWLKTFPIELD